MLTCRLVPLDKWADKPGSPGVRPIGIGEVLRRIVGKTVIGVIKEDIQEAAGPLQSCAGLKSGLEASIHAVKRAWEDTKTEAIILVDADNAFNRLNRKAALHNIRQLCPPFHRYLNNTYQKSAKLIINDGHRCDYVYSHEGATQGDVAAMAKYAVGIRPLIDILAKFTEIGELIQAWYADDSSAVGMLKRLKEWWDALCENGPKLGYFPKPSKTVLIVKNKDLVPTAKALFGGCGMKIVCDGERHLGAAVGTKEFHERYVSAKVEKWVKDIKELSEIAKDEPQAALSAFTKALCHRWTFIQRTIPGIKDLFMPLEKCIRDTFIPAVIGRKVSDIHRRLFALPIRLGGMGIINPVEAADKEYDTSVKVTEYLVDLIYHQATSLKTLDKVKARAEALELAKEKRLKTELTFIMSRLDQDAQRSIELLQEQGSGSCFTALPLGRLSYSLNKVEFRDSICLRYGWEIPNTQRFCSCGKINNLNHILNCKNGGYANWRHDNFRNAIAEYLKVIGCKDVKIEPPLIPIEAEKFQKGNNADKARLDVAAIGLWSTFEKTFVDVRIFNPNSESYKFQTLAKLYGQHENQKKRHYLNRILQVEKGTFSPLVFTTTGGIGPEATRFLKRVAVKLAAKTREKYSDVMNNIRTRISFEILRSVLVAVRGVRGKIRQMKVDPISTLAFNLIPQKRSYEMP